MQKWYSHPITLLLVAVFAIGLYTSLVKTERKIRTSTESVAILDQEVSKIASEVSDLEAEVKTATSAAAQEVIIRDELLLKKPGEYVIQLPSPADNKEPNQDSSKTQPWAQWKKLLMGS
jgi:cell division protein FtsB